MQALSGKASHHPGLSASLQPRFGSLRLPAFPKAKIAGEREEIFECNGHTVHKVIHWRLTANRLPPRESECSRMHGKVSSDWLPSYISAMQLVPKIFKMDKYFPDSPHSSICKHTLKTSQEFHVISRLQGYLLQF